MDRECPNQNSAPVQLEPEGKELQLRVDFFRKLGYSSVEVKAALKKLGVDTDTNSVLGELVGTRTNCEQSVPNPDSDGKGYHNVTPPPPSHAEDREDTENELKPIVIDGSNVAMSHGNKEVFSCRGIQLAVNFFLDRGHTAITVFVPSWRKEMPRPDAPIRDQQILTELEKWKIVVFTPSRRVGGKRVVCYDDRFIVKLAHELDGVIVSNDTYRDLQGERPEWKRCIEERLLMYSFVNDKFMPPDDPLGRHGPSLDNFLRKNPLPAEQRKQFCPYEKKCTYGIKCKFYHPERAHHSYRSLADELRENARAAGVKEERKATASPRGPPADPGPAHHPPMRSLELDMERKLSLHPGKAGENTLPYWSGASQSHDHGSVMWPGPLPARDRLDSGLGSYESQYSDISYGHGNSLWPRHQQHAAPVAPSLPSMHLIGRSAGPACGCCSHVAPSAAHQKRCTRPNPEPHSQPRYDTYPPYVYAPSAYPRYSLPSPAQHSSARPQQQKYCSEPFQQPGMCSHSLPGAICSPAGPGPSCCYGESQQPPWAQARPSSAAFDPERLDLRKKLQAIFNPHQVDKVMEMFPHLMDAQRLAAEILNLKTRGVKL